MGTGFIAASDAQVEAKRIEHWIVSLSILIAADGLRFVANRVIAGLVERISVSAYRLTAHLGLALCTMYQPSAPCPAVSSGRAASRTRNDFGRRPCTRNTR